MQHRLFHVDDGLHKATEMDPYFYMPQLARIISQTNPIKYPLDTFYLFGWSGDMSPQSRKKAGTELYTALKKVVDAHSKDGMAPPITLFSHSHGGNVALNMKHAFDADQNPLIIDKAVFIACPVQKETKDFIQSPLFKTIHSYHSHTDTLQWIDPQGMYHFVQAIKDSRKVKSTQPLKKLWKDRCPLFSERHFVHHPKLKQATICWKIITPWTHDEIALFAPYSGHVKFFLKLQKKKRQLGHLEFMMPTFLSQLPLIVEKVNECTCIPFCSKHPDIAIEL